MGRPLTSPAGALAGRVTVFCQDVPYPPNHGGKLDLWNLLRGLHAEGLTIQLVCWFKRERIAPEVKRQLATVAAEVVEVHRRDGWWRLLYARYPPRMLAFTPSRREYAMLQKSIEAFDPDWLLLDHWLGYLTARTLSMALGRPLVYRSQNVEYLYYRELRQLARGILKLKLGLNASRLLAAEREIRTSVDLVADISADDRDEWDTLGGAGNAIVVPPLWLDRAAPSALETTRDIDLLFVGNLRTPNNVEGLRWFTIEVLPILRRRRSGLRVVFAGSEPDAIGLELWRRAGIECVPNPPAVSGLYPRARVVMNPLQRGSGVNLKMIEALASGRPVVATAEAVRGLPGDVRAQFAICSTPQAFAQAALDILSREERHVDETERAALIDRCFGPTKLRPLIDAMQQIAAAGAAKA